MSNSKVQQLLKERAEILGELASLSLMLHGSIVERFSTCSRPACKCHRGERHGPRRYLVVNEDGRQRQKYIPNAQVEAARMGVTQHKRLLELVDRVTRVNVELIREKAYGGD